MRDLHHVDRIVAGGAEPSLRGLPQVSEEQPGHACRAVRTGFGAQHEARVVAGVPGPRARPEHTPPERAEGAGRRVVGPPHVHTGPLQGADHPLVGETSDRSDERGPDPVLHGVDRADVVAVEVGQHQQVDPVDAEQVEARLQTVRVVPGVDECDRIRARTVSAGPVDSPAEEHGVALAHVARRRRPVRRQPRAHDDAGNGDDRHPDDRDRAGEQEEPEAHRARHEDRDRDTRTDGACGHHPRDAARPRCRCMRQCRRTVGDPPDGARGDPGDRGQDRPAPRPRRRDQARPESHHGHDRREGFGEQVRRHRVGGERRGQRDRHRPARELRGDRHGQCRGRRGPQSTSEEFGERRSEHHDPTRREHGQDEREGPGVPGVDDEHPDDREGDERDPADGTTGQVHHEHDDRHDRRPHDRRVGPDEHDERQQEHHGDGRASVPGQPQRSTEHHDEPDDHRAVRPGHRGEVCQRRGLHRRLGRGVEPAPVPDREAAQERSAGLGQWLGDGDERLTRAVGGGEDPGRRTRRGGAAQEDHGRRHRSGCIGLDRGRRPQPGPGCQAHRPRVVVAGRDHPHRHPQSGEVVDPFERADDGAVAGREVAGQDDLDGDGPVSAVVEHRGTPPCLADQHRHGEQRAQRRRRHGKAGETVRPPPKRNSPDPEHDADADAAAQYPARRCRHPHHHRCADPRHRHRHRDPEVGHPGREVHRHGRQTRTRSWRSANRPSPIPLTSSRSSTAENRPWSSRQARIRWARDGPMPGRVSSVA